MHLRILGHAAVLAVIEHNEVKHRRILEGATHDFVILNARSGVGHGNHARFL